MTCIHEGLTRDSQGEEPQACDADLQRASSHLGRGPSWAWTSSSQWLTEATLPWHPGHTEAASGAGAWGVVQSALILMGLNWVQSPEEEESGNAQTCPPEELEEEARHP